MHLEIAQAWPWVSQHVLSAWEERQSNVEAIVSGFLSSLWRFGADLPENACNALLFGAVIGGSINWFRNRAFRSQKLAIAAELSALNKAILRSSANYLSQLRKGEISDYRKSTRPALQETKKKLTEFQLSYGAFFSKRQWTAFNSFKAVADEVLGEVLWSRLPSKWDDADIAKLWDSSLRNLERDGIAAGAFGQLNAGANDFLKSIGIGLSKRHSMLSKKRTEEAYQALAALKPNAQAAKIRLAA
jgi:hypothetical protein